MGFWYNITWEMSDLAVGAFNPFPDWRSGIVMDAMSTTELGGKVVGYQQTISGSVPPADAPEAWEAWTVTPGIAPWFNLRRITYTQPAPSQPEYTYGVFVVTELDRYFDGDTVTILPGPIIAQHQFDSITRVDSTSIRVAVAFESDIEIKRVWERGFIFDTFDLNFRSERNGTIEIGSTTTQNTYGVVRLRNGAEPGQGGIIAEVNTICASRSISGTYDINVYPGTPNGNAFDAGIDVAHLQMNGL